MASKVRIISALLFVFIAGLFLASGQQVQAVDYTEPVPLPELGIDTFLGMQGGLYPNGQNEPPTAYLAALTAVSEALANDSQIVIVGIGPSIMQNSINGFIPFLNSPEVNDNIVFIDGSLGSNQQRFENPDYFGWNVGINRLPAGLTAVDVDIVFYYNALTSPSGSFPDFVQTAADSFEITYNIINDKFPNVQLILQNSQHYAGHCGQCKAPEPYAYYNGFAVKELIERRINGEIDGALIAWNAYQWDDTWPANYYTDGLHLSGLGQQATGQLWHDYLSTSFNAIWYLDSTAQPTITPTTTAVFTSTPMPTVEVTATPSPFPSITATGEPTMTATVAWCGRACQTATAQAGD